MRLTEKQTIAISDGSEIEMTIAPSATPRFSGCAFDYDITLRPIKNGTQIPPEALAKVCREGAFTIRACA